MNSKLAATCLTIAALSGSAWAQSGAAVGTATDAAAGAVLGASQPAVGGALSGAAGIGIGAKAGVDSRGAGAAAKVDGGAKSRSDARPASEPIDGKPQLDGDRSGRSRAELDEEARIRGAANSQAQGQAKGVAGAADRQAANDRSAAGTVKGGATGSGAVNPGR